MATYLIRRLILALIVLIIITLLVFFVVRYLPGDPILLYMSRQEQQTLTHEQILAAKHQFGLDRPMVVQYFDWINGIFHGNFGESLFYSESVGTLLMRRIPVTLNLGIPAFIIGSTLGVTAGVLSALRRGKALDSVMAILSYMGIAVPIFWLGVLMIYVFGLKMHLLPMFGYIAPSEDLLQNIKHLILPVICLAVTPLASILGGIVFNNRDALLRLNNIIHPAIDSYVGEKIDEFRRKGVKVVVLEAAAMIDADKTDLVDELWVTTAPENVILERLRKRSGYSKNKSMTRINAQLKNGERLKKAAVIINTDCTLNELNSRLMVEWNKLQKRL